MHSPYLRILLRRAVSGQTTYSTRFSQLAVRVATKPRHSDTKVADGELVMAAREEPASGGTVGFRAGFYSDIRSHRFRHRNVKPKHETAATRITLTKQPGAVLRYSVATSADVEDLQGAYCPHYI
jgi:hypothetical protein